MDFEQKRKIGLGTTAPRSSSERSVEADRLVSAGRVDDDDAVELKLRPKRLADLRCSGALACDSRELAPARMQYVGLRQRAAVA